MKTVLICSQKGGVGKSLISDEIAFSFERSGIPMAFIDLDQQGGTIHQTNERSDAEVLVVDTPGALQARMKNWMSDADVVVIPVRPTSRDIPPLLRTLDIAHSSAPETPIVIVINAWNRFSASLDFKEWIQGQKQCADATLIVLPQSERFVQASAAGMSVVSYAKRTTAAKATLDMVNTIRNLIGISKE